MSEKTNLYMPSCANKWALGEAWDSGGIPLSIPYMGVCVCACMHTFICVMERLPWWLSSRESACNGGDVGLILGLGRSPEEGNGYPLQYSCLENPMDRGVWQVTVHGVAKNWTQLSD